MAQQPAPARRVALLAAASAATIAVSLASGHAHAGCVAPAAGRTATCSGDTAVQNLSVSTTAGGTPAVAVAPGASLKASAGSVSTSGSNSAGVTVGEGASLSLGADVTTSGAVSDGVLVLGPTGGAPVGVGGKVTTTGTSSSGVVARDSSGNYVSGVAVDVSGDVRVEGGADFRAVASGIGLGKGAKVSLSGSVTTLGDDVAGVRVGAGSRIAGSDSAKITTSGAFGTGIVAGTASDVEWNGKLATSGEGAQGISVFASDVTVGAGGKVSTTGKGAHAVSGGSGGTIAVDGAVATSGTYSRAVDANANGVNVFEFGSDATTSVEVGKAGSVSASGEGSNGISVLKVLTTSESRVSVDGAVSASGDYGSAVSYQEFGRSAFSLLVSGEVAASGRRGNGVTALLDGGTLVANISGSVSATGEGGNAIFVTGTNTGTTPGVPAAVAKITVREGASVSSERGPAIMADRLGDTPLGVNAVRTNLTIAGTVSTAVDGGRAVSLDRADDRVDLTPTFVLKGIVDGGDGEDTLGLAGGAGTHGSLVLGGGYSFSNFEALRKTGAGTWKISGDAPLSFVRDAFVESGTLELGTDLSGTAFEIGSGGRLSGNGTLGRLRVAGDLAPGTVAAPVGRLSVAGDLAFLDGSRFLVDVSAARGADTVAATGAASLSGTVVANALDPYTSYANGRTFEILSADGGVTGRFGSVAGGSLFLSFTPVYEGKRVLLAATVSPPVVIDPPVNPPVINDPLVRPPVTPPPVAKPKQPEVFPAVARTYNQARAAHALNGLSQQSGSDAVYVFNQILFSRTAEEARSAFDIASGEIHTAVQADIVREAARFSSVLLGRSGIEQETREGGTPAWTALSYGRLEHDGDGNATATQDEAFNVAVGADVVRFNLGGREFVGGVALGYGNGGVEDTDRRSRADRASLGFGAYSGVAIGPVGLSSTVSYGRHEVDTTRDVRFGALARKAEADYSADTFAASGKVEYRTEIGGLSVTPYLTGTLGRAETNGGRETGAGAVGLDVRGEGFGYADGGIGLRVERDVAVGKAKVALRADMSAHKTDGGSPSQRLSLAGSRAPFDIRGVGVNEARVDIDIGARVDKKGVSLEIGYRGSVGEESESHAVMAKLGFSL